MSVIKYVLQVKDDGVDKWWFSYNAAGQLIRMKRTEGDNEVTTIKYTDGDITSVSMTSDDSDNAYTCTISYGDEPILNKGGLMLFDKTFSIDMDEMYPAYLAGLLGYATKHRFRRTTARGGRRGIQRGLSCRCGYVRSCGKATWCRRRVRIRCIRRCWPAGGGSALRDGFRCRLPSQIGVQFL